MEPKFGRHQFAINVYWKLLENSNGNSCISPTSLMTALSVLYAGARSNTEDQIKEGLKIEGTQDDVHTANKELIKNLTMSDTTFIANALFIQNGFIPSSSFLSIARNNYNAEILNMDFRHDPVSCVNQANDWAKKATRGKIDKITEGFDILTVMVIINAVYFKSAWKLPFDSFSTQPKQFFLNEKCSILAKLMSQTGNFLLGQNKEADCQVLELPYEDDKTSMIILLPNEIEGLPKVEASLSPDFLDDVFNSLKESEVKVTLPLFKLECTYNLVDTLKQLGMKDMFLLNQANFTGINTTANLYVSDVIQKTFLKIHELGTEAAAITSTAIALCGHIGKISEFNVNHPFFYLIIGRDLKDILFMGKLNSPDTVD